MTQIINLYGGPSTGKSTSAAYIYFLLKSEDEAKGMDQELRAHMSGYSLIESATDEMALTTLINTLLP